MTADFRLVLAFRHYWRPGTGRGSGSHVDALAETDRFGCPFISGRMLKGVLRDAVFRLMTWGGPGHSGPDLSAERIVEILFGSWGFTGDRPRDQTRPGVIRVGDAVLEEPTRRWLANHPEYRQGLFRDIYTTAIDPERGVARQGSLRGEQVVVPMELVAPLHRIPLAELFPAREALEEEIWVANNSETIIGNALPLIRNIGAGRSRGLGRVELKLKNDPGEAAQ